MDAMSFVLLSVLYIANLDVVDVISLYEESGYNGEVLRGVGQS